MIEYYSIEKNDRASSFSGIKVILQGNLSRTESLRGKGAANANLCDVNVLVCALQRLYSESPSMHKSMNVKCRVRGDLQARFR